MKVQEEVTEKMKEIAEYFREGAMAYLKSQYTVVGKIFIVLVVLLSNLAYMGVQNPFVPVAFLTGGFFSGCAEPDSREISPIAAPTKYRE